MVKGKSLLFLLKAEFLHVNGLLVGHTLFHGRLLEVLAGTHLADGTGLFEFALEFLERSLDIFAFFDLYDNHAFTPPFSFRGCKVRK